MYLFVLRIYYYYYYYSVFVHGILLLILFHFPFRSEQLTNKYFSYLYLSFISKRRAPRTTICEAFVSRRAREQGARVRKKTGQ